MCIFRVRLLLYTKAISADNVLQNCFLQGSSPLQCATNQHRGKIILTVFICNIFCAVFSRRFTSLHMLDRKISLAFL